MKYNVVVSLGTTCISSWMCKKAELKRFSCPFDWIFSNTHMIIDCLSNDFSVFLDKTQYSHYLDNSKSARHKKYGDIFLHHDPRQKDDYDYFVRCVDRFRNISGNISINILFLQIFLNKTVDQVQNIIHESNEICKFLTEHIKSNFTLLVIVHVTDSLPELYQNEIIKDNFIFHVIHIDEVLKTSHFLIDENNKTITNYLSNRFEYDLLTKKQLFEKSIYNSFIKYMEKKYKIVIF